MNLHELIARVAKGEDTGTQFKADLRNNDALAAEMAAFANAEGGSILIGVADDGSMPGLSREDVSRINQMIGNLTVEKIRTGNSNIRNPILASYVAKGVLPYHGIGSGIKRALADWPDITFADDRDGCLFTATVARKEPKLSGKSSLKSSGKSSGKTDAQILHLLSGNPHMTIPEMAAALEITTRGVKKQLAALKKQTRLRRVGPDKGGHWEVLP